MNMQQQQQRQQEQVLAEQNQMLQQKLPKHRVLIFNGYINPPTSNNFRIMLCQLINQGAEEVTVLFSSGGGSVDDGVALYTILRSLPVKITIHAVGVVGSIAIPVFLAAPNRVASVNSRFFFHDFTWTFPTQLAPRTTILEASMLLKNALDWTKNILTSETKLTNKEISKKKILKEPCIMSPFEAEQHGLVQSIGEPSYDLSNIPMVVM
jgi:ATP-dependent Clp protease protease subunit